MPGSGGKREGSGRKKGSHNTATAELKEIIEKVISTEERVKLLAELSRGVTIEEPPKTLGGLPKIYTKPPDALAIKQLNEYQYGKPKESVTLDGTVEVTIHTTK